MGDADGDDAKFFHHVSLTTEHKTLLILLLSAMAYSVMGCFVKLCTSSGLPSTEVVLFRAVFQMTIVAGAMFYYTPNGTVMDSVSTPLPTSSPEGSKHRDEELLHSTSQRMSTRTTTYNSNDPLIRHPFGSKDVYKIVIVRGMVGGGGFCLYYYTISALPLGDAVTILSLSPMITVLMARVALNETITPTHTFAALSSVVGSICLVRPSFLFGDDGGGVMTGDGLSSGINQQHPHRQWGYLTGILGACCGASVYILIRKAGKKGVHTLNLLFSWCVFGLLFSIGILISGGNGNTFAMPSTAIIWWYVLWNCVFGTLAHFLMNYAARMAPAGVASIIRSSGIVWSYLLEVLVFDQIPQAWTILGVGLILASLLGIAWEQQQDGKEQQQDGKEQQQDGKEQQCHDKGGSRPLQRVSEFDGGSDATEALSITSFGSIIGDSGPGAVEMKALIR